MQEQDLNVKVKSNEAVLQVLTYVRQITIPTSGYS